LKGTAEFQGVEILDEEIENNSGNKEKCFEKAINWLKGTAEFQGVEILDEEIENLRVKWLEND